MTPEQLKSAFVEVTGQLLALTVILESLPNKNQIDKEATIKKIRSASVSRTDAFSLSDIRSVAENHLKKIL